jgi:hypothetical protein
VPLNTPDFSSFLLQAQASKAKVIGLANAGGDTTNSIKQAAEFGIVAGGQKLAALLTFISNIHALGLDVAQGLTLTSTFYWDMNEGTRAFSKRFSDRMSTHAKPTMVQAGDYSSTLHYLKTLEAMGGNPHDGAKVVAKMKEMPTDDPLFGKGVIREDGRKIHPGLSLRSEETLGIEISLGLLQASRDNSGRGSVPSACAKRVPARQEVEFRPAVLKRGRPATDGWGHACSKFCIFLRSNCFSSFWSV